MNQYTTPAKVAYVMSATGCPEQDAILSLEATKGDEEEAILDIRNIY